MSDKEYIVDKIRTKLYPRTFKALLGLGDSGHTVNVSGKANYVYVRVKYGSALGVPVEALNRAVPPIHGRMVRLREIDRAGIKGFEVIGFDDKGTPYYHDDTRQNVVPAHGHTHECNQADFGTDPVNLYTRGWAELRVEPTNPISMYCYVTRGWYLFDIPAWFTGGNTPLFTAPALARYDVVYLDSSGTINIEQGIEGAPATVFIPEPPDYTIPLAVIQMTGSTGGISEDMILDSRVMPNVKYPPGGTVFDDSITPSTVRGGWPSWCGEEDYAARADHRHDLASGTMAPHDHTVDGTGGQLDHGSALIPASLLDDDHTLYLKERLSGGLGTEVPVHTHAAGEGGQIDHGAALTGLLDDDHTQYIKDVEFQAKGDLLAGSGVGAFGRLAVGADALVLTADSAQPLGLSWGSGLPTGTAPPDYPYLGFGTAPLLTAEVNYYDFYGRNLVRNSPGQIVTDGAEPQWWDDVANATITDEDCAGEGIADITERCYKVVTTANDVYGYQTFTFADEDLLDAGQTVISEGIWVWCASGSKASVAIYGANLGLQESSQHAGSSAWELLKVENITLDAADTSIEVRLIVDTGTAYFTMPMLNAGPRALPWRTRSKKYQQITASYGYTAGPHTETLAWTEYDWTALTDALAVRGDHVSWLRQTAAHLCYFFGRPGYDEATGADVRAGIIRKDDVTEVTMRFEVDMDDRQVWDYYTENVDGATFTWFQINIVGYWMWE